MSRLAMLLPGIRYAFMVSQAAGNMSPKIDDSDIHRDTVFTGTICHQILYIYGNEGPKNALIYHQP